MQGRICTLDTLSAGDTQGCAILDLIEAGPPAPGREGVEQTFDTVGSLLSHSPVARNAETKLGAFSAFTSFWWVGQLSPGVQV